MALEQDERISEVFEREQSRLRNFIEDRTAELSSIVALNHQGQKHGADAPLPFLTGQEFTRRGLWNSPWRIEEVFPVCDFLLHSGIRHSLYHAGQIAVLKK